MSERREFDVIDAAARTLRSPVVVDPAAKQRLVAALRDSPVPRVGAGRRAWHWIARPRPVMVSPLWTAAAAVLIMIGVFRAAIGWERTGEQPAAVPPAPGGPAVAAASNLHAVQFVLVAPGAASVALVGDFNGWDTGETPLAPSASGGLWSVEVPLAPGRHVYSFVVDGRRWIPDPSAARAPDSDFGTPSSVVLVGERSL
ncbi:MAG TPA: hypothetical protein VMM18_08930 [Gemmatimonadaceae bacterium]|nr:hypothetical protein [Gemmatimonadaceae bacterium]